MNKKKKLKALVVAENTVGLSNSFECLNHLNILPKQACIFFSGKLDNLKKYNQSKKLIEIIKPEIRYFNLKVRKLSPWIPYIGSSKIVKMILYIINKQVIKWQLIHINRNFDFEYIIGDPWSFFQDDEELFKGAERWIVQTGTAKGQRFFEKTEQGFHAFAAGNSSEWGIEESRFTENKQCLKNFFISKKSSSKNLAIFVSANQNGLYTYSDWYIESMKTTRRLHSGKIIYFPRSNEPEKVAKSIAKRYDFEWVEPILSFEDYLAFEINLLPGRIFHISSTVGYFLGNTNFRELWVNTILLPTHDFKGLNDKSYNNIVSVINSMKQLNLIYEVVNVMSSDE